MNGQNYQEELRNAILLHSGSYRLFLKEVVALKKKYAKHFSYASFSMKAGFSSKSFLRDIIFGKKRITERSMPKMLKGFSFPRDIKNLFCCMVAIEEDLDFLGLNLNKIEKYKNNYIQKVKEKSLPRDKPTLSGIFKIPNWQVIYTSLLSVKKGSSQLTVISKMTGVSEKQCQKSLSEMLKIGLVTICRDTKAYFPSELNLIIDKLGENEFYKEYFLTSLQRASKAAKLRISSNETLFLTSTISITLDQKTELRRKLKSLIEEFIVEAESTPANKIVELNLSFF